MGLATDYITGPSNVDHLNETHEAIVVIKKNHKFCFCCCYNNCITSTSFFAKKMCQIVYNCLHKLAGGA